MHYFSVQVDEDVVKRYCDHMGPMFCENRSFRFIENVMTPASTKRGSNISMKKFLQYIHSRVRYHV